MLDGKTAAAISAALLLAASLVSLVVWASLRAHARAEAKAEALREETEHDEDLPASPRCPRCGALLCGHFDGGQDE